MRQFRYYRNNMYAVINVITIIRHQLRCIGQVTFFLFLVHIIGSCHLSIQRLSNKVWYIYWTPIQLKQSSVQAMRHIKPGVSTSVVFHIRSSGTCLSVCLSLLPRPEFSSYRVGIHNLGPTLCHLKMVFWIFGWVHFLGQLL